MSVLEASPAARAEFLRRQIDARMLDAFIAARDGYSERELRLIAERDAALARAERAEAELEDRDAGA